ncbi:unnamed protein product [Blepharisma stoltei]|uniref:Uncharacterized protein n=1 Tax=Blepharisma stoltei TaxID=1481888 RepID=A0AAU9IBA1_9CILI|nr:unnamed protein product [Blepharisma stoltei]
MSNTGLTRKLTWGILVPLVAGMVLITIIASVPLYIQYPTWIDNYINHMINDQGNAMLNVSSFVGKTGSSNVVQYAANLMIIANILMEEYLVQDILSVKNDFNYEDNYVSGVGFDEGNMTVPGLIEKTNMSYYAAMWYLNPDIKNSSLLPPESYRNLKSSAVFDSFLRPMAQLGDEASPYFGDVYIGYDIDGFFYTNPTYYRGYFLNYSEMNCSYNQGSPAQFDPRCRPWYAQTKTSTSPNNPSIVLTEPYQSISNFNLGQSACTGLWYGNQTYILTACIDYSLTSAENHLLNVSVGGSTYSYALAADGRVIIHPKLNRTSNVVPPITQLEFGNNPDQDEVNYYNEHILPYFKQVRTIKTYYYKNGEKMMIAISPILIKQDIEEHQTHWASIGIVMNQKEMTKDVEGLKEDCNILLYVEYGIFGSIELIIAVLCYYLTKNIARTIVAPIDKLSEILDKLIKHDLGLDIMEQYEPGPPEINALYEVFDKLRVVLKLHDPSQFKHETNAMMNYAQALNLFSKFRNKKAMELCYRELGNIHFRSERYQDAALSYYNSYRIAKQIEGFPEQEMVKRKTQTAKAMMIAGVRKEEAMEMFHEAIDFYQNSSKDSVDVILCLLEKIEGLFAIGENTEFVLDETEKLLKARFSVSYQDILQQRYLFFRALQYETQEDYQTASRLYVLCLENFMEFDPMIRKKSIERLIEIFEMKNLPVADLVVLKEEMENKSKDIALIVDTKFDGKEFHHLILWLISSVVDTKDRLSIINFDDEFHILFNLTKKPAKQIEFPTLDLMNQGGKSVLYDGINAGIEQLYSFRSENTTFLGQEDIRHKWIIAICNSDDIGSQISFAEISKKIRDSGARLIIFYINSDPSPHSQLESLKNYSIRGIFLSAYSQTEIRRAFQRIAAIICPFKLFLVN